jgi:hypothetical protein
MSYDDIPAAPPALADFARANRNLISYDLEAKLAAAGYLPTDDPDNLSEQEWITKYNVTVQELESLRRLYYRSVLPDPALLDIKFIALEFSSARQR